MKHLPVTLALTLLLSACGTTDGGEDISFGENELRTWTATCTTGHDWTGLPQPSLSAAQGAARDHDIKEHAGQKTARVVDQ